MRQFLRMQRCTAKRFGMTNEYHYISFQGELFTNSPFKCKKIVTIQKLINYRMNK